MKNLGQPLSALDRGRLGGVEFVFFDIDDTFSGGHVPTLDFAPSGGHATLAAVVSGIRSAPAVAVVHEHRILPEAYDALWRLARAGIKVIPVTGRPAGWCDMIARMWPVAGVVGENGAFFCELTREHRGGKPGPTKLLKTYLESAATRTRNAARLKKLHAAILKKFPGAKTASDQAFREFDLAIDYCEDVKPWPMKRVDLLLEFCRKRGAIAKLSSIHVNTWFGQYDKLRCVRRVLNKRFALSDFAIQKKVIYIGDSPNDEPFFEAFELSVGVANVRRYFDGVRLRYRPAFVTEQESGEGFKELAEAILQAKQK